LIHGDYYLQQNQMFFTMKLPKNYLLRLHRYNIIFLNLWVSELLDIYMFSLIRIFKRFFMHFNSVPIRNNKNSVYAVSQCTKILLDWERNDPVGVLLTHLLTSVLIKSCVWV
jgi:hypothetical protein